MRRAVKTLYLSYETAMVQHLRRWPLSPARSRNSRFDSLICQLRCRPYRRRDKINPRQSYISYCDDKWSNVAPPCEYVGNCDYNCSSVSRSLPRHRSSTATGVPVGFRISKTSRNSPHIITMAVARCSSDDNAIRYVLPVLWMTSCLATIGDATATAMPIRRILDHQRQHQGEAWYDIYDCLLVPRHTSHGPLWKHDVIHKTRTQRTYVLHCRQRRTEPRRQLTQAEIFSWSLDVLFEMRGDRQRQTDRHSSSQYFGCTPYWNRSEKFQRLVILTCLVIGKLPGRVSRQCSSSCRFIAHSLGVLWVCPATDCASTISDYIRLIADSSRRRLRSSSSMQLVIRRTRLSTFAVARCRL